MHHLEQCQEVSPGKHVCLAKQGNFRLISILIYILLTNLNTPVRNILYLLYFAKHQI